MPRAPVRRPHDPPSSDALQEDLRALQRQLLASMQPSEPAMQLLLTMPGIDALAAAKLPVEIGDDMNAFGNAGKLAKWAGICPGNGASASKRKSGKTTKGNRYVRALLCEIAWAAARTASQFNSRYLGLVIRRGTKRTIVAIAHTVLKIVFVLPSRQVPYRDSTVDYEALAPAPAAPGIASAATLQASDADGPGVVKTVRAATGAEAVMQ